MWKCGVTMRVASGSRVTRPVGDRQYCLGQHVSHQQVCGRSARLSLSIACHTMMFPRGRRSPGRWALSIALGAPVESVQACSASS